MTAGCGQGQHGFVTSDSDAATSLLFAHVGSKRRVENLGPCERMLSRSRGLVKMHVMAADVQRLLLSVMFVVSQQKRFHTFFRRTWEMCLLRLRVVPPIIGGFRKNGSSRNYDFDIFDYNETDSEEIYPKGHRKFYGAKKKKNTEMQRCSFSVHEKRNRCNGAVIWSGTTQGVSRVVIGARNSPALVLSTCADDPAAFRQPPRPHDEMLRHSLWGVGLPALFPFLLASYFIAWCTPAETQ